MPSTLKEIEEQALELSPEERAQLAQTLLEWLHVPTPEIEKAWADEIERRLEAYDRGEMETYAAEDVFAEARCVLR